MTTSTANATDYDPHAALPGTVVARRPAGSVTIHIVKAVDGYSINTWSGPEMVHNWCTQTRTWDEARTAAEHTRQAFRAHGTAEAIDVRAEQLRWTLQQQDQRRGNMRSAALIAAVEAELATLEDLETRRVRAALVNHLTEAAA